MTRDAAVRREGASAPTSLGRLLRPASVAIVGASPSPGSLGGGVLANLERFGFAGTIHPVNPKYDHIGERRCVGSVEALPDGVDCAVLAVARSQVPAAVRACAVKGLGGVIVLAGGFAEEGEDGRRAQAEITAVALGAGMALQGPNCLGTTNYVAGAAMMFGAAPADPLGNRPGVAIVSQSGAMAAVVRVALQARGIGLSYAVSTGNEAVLGAEDFLEEFLLDPHTRVVAMLMEQVREPARFLTLADRARTLGKAIVLEHLGRSAAGQAAAATHTGAMSGDYSVMAAQVRARGVHLVATLEELIDVSELLIRFGGRAPAAGTMVVTESGAFKGMALDFCEAAGLDLPTLPTHAFDTLRAELPPFTPPSNPLDLTAQALVDPSLYERVIAAVASEPCYASMVVAITLPSAESADRKLPPIVAALDRLGGRVPTVFAMLGEDCPIPQGHIDAIRATGVPFFRSPERAFRALAALGGSAEVRHRPCLEGAAMRLAPGDWPEHRAKALLARHGLPVGEGRLARTVEEAVQAADAVGWPVVLKAQSSALPHKSDAGGVAMRIADADALTAAWTTMHERLAAARPGLALDGVLVERMAPDGVELIIGARHVAGWGPVILLGMGGVLAEVMEDSVLVPAVLGREAAAAALASLRGARLFGGYRGKPPADTDAVLDIVDALADLLLRHPEIVEMDLNPVVAHARGQGASVLDALMVVC